MNKALIFSISLLISCIGMSSCKDKNVSAEVKNWCACMKSADENGTLRDSCQVMMEKISSDNRNNAKVLSQIQEEAALCY